MKNKTIGSIKITFFDSAATEIGAECHINGSPKMSRGDVLNASLAAISEYMLAFDPCDCQACSAARRIGAGIKALMENEANIYEQTGMMH